MTAEKLIELLLDLPPKSPVYLFAFGRCLEVDRVEVLSEGEPKRGAMIRPVDAPNDEFRL